MTRSFADKGMLVLMTTFPVAAWAGILCAIQSGAGKGPWSYVPEWLTDLTVIATLISILLGFYIAFRALWIPAGRFTLWHSILCGFTITPVIGFFLPTLFSFF